MTVQLSTSLREQNDGVRRPEDTVRAMHVAHQLHAAMTARPRARLDFKARAPVEESRALLHLDDRIRQRILLAMAHCADEMVRQQVVQIAHESSFGRLTVTLQAVALDALTQGPIDETLARDATRLFRQPSLDTLSEVVQEQLFRSAFRVRGVDHGRNAIIGLAEDPGFLRLAESEQADLLRYLSGPQIPTTAGPERAALLQRHWVEERARMETLRSAPDYLEGDAELRASMLFDYLHFPSERVYFLEALIFGGRSVVILGDPADPTALSYGQIPIINVGQRRRARLESPDACVAAGWVGVEEATFTYRFRCFSVSRDERRRFVQWAESSFVMNEYRDRLPSLGPKRSVVDGRRFFDTALRVVRLYDGEGQEGYMQRGTACTAEIETAESRECDQMLARFLSVTV